MATVPDLISEQGLEAVKVTTGLRGELTFSIVDGSNGRGLVRSGLGVERSALAALLEEVKDLRARVTELEHGRNRKAS